MFDKLEEKAMIHFFNKFDNTSSLPFSMPSVLLSSIISSIAWLIFL